MYQKLHSSFFDFFTLAQILLTMDFILQPWPWYVSGPLIGAIMFALLYFDKTFGMSSNLRALCSMAGAGKKIKFFAFDWKSQLWNLTVVLGSIIGGFIAVQALNGNATIDLNPTTKEALQHYGFQTPGEGLAPMELYGTEALAEPSNIGLLVLAGLCIGFGTRYAGGCTSGHAITGLSSLQLPSLVAVIGFFIGGLLMTHLIFPLLF